MAFAPKPEASIWDGTVQAEPTSATRSDCGREAGSPELCHEYNTWEDPGIGKNPPARWIEAGVGWRSSCAPIDCGAMGPAFGFPADWRTACSNCACRDQ